MAEVTKSESVLPTISAGPHPHRQGERNPYEGKEREHGHAERREVADRASVLGIPAGSLTPEVEEAIRGLMEEVDGLRQELDVAKRHEAYLGQLADQHSYLPLYNRRAFLREMSRALVRAEHTGVACSFLYLHMINLAEIRRRFGRLAGDRAMVHAAWIIRNGLRGSDLLGSMDGYDFVILLMIADEAAAIAKAEGLMAEVARTPMQWFDTQIDLRLSCGLHAFRAGETADEVIDAAENDLRRGGPKPPGEAEG